MKIIQVTVFLLLFGLLASVCASETKWVPGVAVGDYFTYDMYGVYANQSR